MKTVNKGHQHHLIACSIVRDDFGRKYKNSRNFLQEYEHLFTGICLKQRCITVIPALVMNSNLTNQFQHHLISLFTKSCFLYFWFEIKKNFSLFTSYVSHWCCYLHFIVLLVDDVTNTVKYLLEHFASKRSVIWMIWWHQPTALQQGQLIEWNLKM